MTDKSRIRIELTLEQVECVKQILGQKEERSSAFKAVEELETRAAPIVIAV